MMTLKKVPIAATPIQLKAILSSLEALFAKGKFKEQLKTQFSQFVNKKYLFFLSSGSVSFFVILEALKKISQRKEVILPAYTASSLIIAIKKAGLKPILCDVSLDDFNIDVNLLPEIVTKETLCILGVHMFGIVDTGLKGLKERFPDVFIAEDCAQGLGSKINGVSCGNLTDISFFSFNRGKNLPTYGGGFIAVNNEELARKVEEEMKDLKEENLFFKFSIPFKILALSLVVRPIIYGLGYPLISKFKEVAPLKDFKVKKYTDFQGGVALTLLKGTEEFSKRRYDNGIKLIEGLKDLKGIILPKIATDTQPAFNRLPIVFKDLKIRKRVEANLCKVGIESSRMYYKPLHHIFDFGYKKDDFPNATYFAERLLTLPTHPLVDEEIITKMVDLIREVLK